MTLHNPQISYEKDRKENGMLSIMEKKENREIYKGVQYCKYRYRRGNGEDPEKAFSENYSFAIFDKMKDE